jgi:hypothetical protein
MSNGLGMQVHPFHAIKSLATPSGPQPIMSHGSDHWAELHQIEVPIGVQIALVGHNGNRRPATGWYTFYDSANHRWWAYSGEGAQWYVYLAHGGTHDMSLMPNYGNGYTLGAVGTEAVTDKWHGGTTGAPIGRYYYTPPAPQPLPVPDPNPPSPPSLPWWYNLGLYGPHGMGATDATTVAAPCCPSGSLAWLAGAVAFVGVMIGAHAWAGAKKKGR